MKITIISNIILLFIAFKSFAGDPITLDMLPANTKNYIDNHFGEHSIFKAEIDNNLFGTTYEVKLNNDIELDFNKNGEIVGIDGNNSLPESLIPPAISTYVKTNYPNNFITDWEKKRFMQEIELDNGVELIFNKKGRAFSVVIKIGQ